MSVLLVECCYWKRANSWGATAAIAFGAIIPVTFLVLQQLLTTKQIAEDIGTYYSGIATYLLAVVAMVAGSLMKPQHKRVQSGWNIGSGS